MGAVKAALVTCPECGNSYPAWETCNACLVMQQEDAPVAPQPFTPDTAPSPVIGIGPDSPIYEEIELLTESQELAREIQRRLADDLFERWKEANDALR